MCGGEREEEGEETESGEAIVPKVMLTAIRYVSGFGNGILLPIAAEGHGCRVLPATQQSPRGRDGMYYQYVSLGIR